MARPEDGIETGTVISKHSVGTMQELPGTIYRTTDGFEFKSLEEAKRHQRYVDIPTEKFEFSEDETVELLWVFLKDEDDVETLMSRCPEETVKPMAVPGWYLWKSVWDSLGEERESSELLYAPVVVEMFERALAQAKRLSVPVVP